MSKVNTVALFTALPLALQTLTAELILTRMRNDNKANLADVVDEVMGVFNTEASGEALTGSKLVSGGTEDTNETQPEEKPLTAAQKKKAAAEKKAADEAAAAAAAEDKAAKKKPAGKNKKPEIDLTPFKEQVGDFLEWLGDDKADEIAAIVDEFGVDTADEVPDESYTEFYKLVRELADKDFDLSEVEDLLAA